MKKIINIQEIRLPIHYFNKMLKNMWLSEKKKENYTAKHETLIGFEESDTLIEGIGILDEVDFGDWKNLIQDECLFNALISLTKQELILLKMWAVDGYIQKDLAILMNISEMAVTMRISRIKDKIKKNYKKV